MNVRLLPHRLKKTWRRNLMKRKRSLATVTLSLLLVLLLGVTGFAAEDPGETDVTDGSEETVDETAEDNKAATIYVEKDGGILLTIDAEGNILSAEYVNELEENDEATEEDNDEEKNGDLEPDEPTEEESEGESEDVEEKVSLEDLVGESLIDGLEALLDAEETDAYVIVIDSEDEEYLAELEIQLENHFGELLNSEPTEEMESTHPLAQRFAMAQELGITPGKMNLLEKLGNGYGEDAEVNFEEWAEKSVKEIMAAVNAERKAARQVVEEGEDEDTDMEMEVLTQSIQEDAGNGNRGNGNAGRGNRGNSGNSNGNRSGNASNGNPGRGNNK